MVQLASAVATPTLAERASVAPASPSAETVVIGTNQPQVNPTASAATSEAASPRRAFRPKTASPRARSTIRSETTIVRLSSKAGSTPGP